MKTSNTARARVGLGVTIPVGGAYGSVRVDIALEDPMRPEDGDDRGALRRRVAREARMFLKSEVKRALKKHGLDSRGNPVGREARWV